MRAITDFREQKESEVGIEACPDVSVTSHISKITNFLRPDLFFIKNSAPNQSVSMKWKN